MSKTAQNNQSVEDTDAEFFKTLNIQAGSAQLVKDCINLALDVDIPLSIWGRAGIGKTQLVHQVAQERNMDLLVLYLHHMDKEDISGFPFPDPNDPHSVLMRVKKTLPREKSKRNGTIVFLDEWNRADKSVVNAIFTLMERPRRAGDLVLPDDVRVILSANPSGGSYAVNEAEMDPAIRRRAMHIGMIPSISAFLEYAQKGFVPTVASEARPLPKLVQERTFHRSVVSYIRAHRQALYDMEAHNAGRVGANPASWEKVSQLLYQIEAVHKDLASKEPVLRMLTSGLIGLKATSDFVTEVLHQDADSVDPDEILDGDFKAGSDAYERVKKLVKSRAAGSSGKISQLATSLALAIASKKAPPASVTPAVAAFVNMLEGDTQQKFLTELTKELKDQDTPDQAYQKAFSKSLGEQAEYREAVKRMSSRTSALEKKLKDS